MRKQNKPPAREPSDSNLRAIEQTETELLAIQNDDGTDDEPLPEDVAPVGSTMGDFADLGLDRLAYVRRAVVDDVPVWSIYNASGLPIGAARTLEKAWGAIVQSDMQPLFLH